MTDISIIRRLQGLQRHINDLEADLAAAAATLAATREALAEARSEAERGYETALQDATALGTRAVATAIRDIAFRDRELRVLKTQLRLTRGWLERHRDSFLYGTEVDDLLASLTRAAADEPTLERDTNQRRPP